MTTDFRTLLENLVEEVLDANQYKPPGVQRAIDRARAALAEPEGPDAVEVMQLADNYFSFRGNSHRDQFFATSMEARKNPTQSLQDFARAVLARWGRPS